MESSDTGATTVGDGATATLVETEVSISQPESTLDKPPLPPKGKKPTNTGSKVSPAWDHFDKIDFPDGRRVAICKYCKKELSAASKLHETSSLLSHTVSCINNPNKELRGQKTLSFEPKKEEEEGFDLVATILLLRLVEKNLLK